MSALPLKLLKLKILREVPRSEYSDLLVPEDLGNEKVRLNFLKKLRQKPSKTRINDAPKTKNLSFNAAVWLTLARVTNKPVSLWLTYKDASGERTVLVDEQDIGESRSAMLSGNVSLDVRGDIEYLRACCAGIDQKEELEIEDLHVRRLEDEVEQLNPLQQMA